VGTHIQRDLQGGRKAGAAWVTEPMSETARAEARKLTRGWSPPFGPEDHKLVLALLRSAKAAPTRESERPRSCAVAMQRAASPSPCYVGLTAMAEPEVSRA
jgi:hypothetical protein